MDINSLYHGQVPPNEKHSVDQACTTIVEVWVYAEDSLVESNSCQPGKDKVLHKSSEWDQKLPSSFQNFDIDCCCSYGCYGYVDDVIVVELMLIE